ncbi:MAG: sensor histidine kinase [Eubacteriales bacterium]|nr:sensor histidine kinase [Eubacteriales bacterium]
MKKEHTAKKPGWLFRFKSIRTSILLSFAVLVISALAIFLVFSMNFTQNAVLENSIDYTSQLVDQLNADIDSYMNYMENIAELVTSGSNVSDVLFSKNILRRESAKGRIAEQFATVLSTRSDICNIGILGDNGRYLINNEEAVYNEYANIEGMKWYQQTMAAGGTPVVSYSHVQNIVKDSYQWVVTLSMGLKNPDTGDIEGIFFIDLNYSAISDLCEQINLGNKGYLFILDSEGNIVYHPWQQLLYNGLKTERIQEVLDAEDGSFVTKEGDNSKLYTLSRSEKTGWTVAGVAYTNELMKNKEEMQLMYLVAAFVLFLAAILFAALITSGITKPVKTLRNFMKEVEQGHFDHVYIPVYGENEFASLNNSFNIMADRIQELMEANVQEQKEKRKSELQALQAQINPHFLYNTLDSIIWMAEWGKNKEVVLMTSSLAKLLRQSISNEKEIVTIEQEIDYTRSYLTIQKMRYKDQLEFEIDVDPDILKVPIVKLVVQPLAENAIYHSIKYMEEKGTIRITGEEKDGDILLNVSDDGVGMDAETLAHILEKKPDDRERKHKGVGIYNVHNRLQLYYGKEYGLSYESAKGQGTTVHIRIPNTYQEEAGHEQEEI